MALPTLVNGQITDAVSQTHIATLGASGASAASVLSQSAAHLAQIGLANFAAAETNLNTLRQAATSAAVAQTLSED